MTDHSHFEILCALATTGQLSEREQADLTNHLEQCRPCSGRLHDMAQVSSQILLAKESRTKHCPVPKGMQKRFLDRAIREGIPLNDPNSVSWMPNILGITCAALFVTSIFLFVHWKPNTFSRNASMAQSNEAGALAGLKQTDLSAPGNSTMSRPVKVPVTQDTVPQHRRRATPTVASGALPASADEHRSMHPISIRHRSVKFTMYEPTLSPRDYSAASTIVIPKISSLLASTYISPGHTSPRITSNRTSNIPQSWDHFYRSMSGPQVFHYDSSIAFLDYPQSPAFDPSRLNFKVAFHTLRFSISEAE